MFQEVDFSEFTDHEIEENLQKINERYAIAMRLGKTHLANQLASYSTCYQEEYNNRMSKKIKSNKSLEKLINVS